MVTIKDIAKEANVSIATVSRYLNNKLTLKPQTEAQINEAIKKLGYVPNMVAQSLKNNRTQNVAVILPMVNHLYSSDMTSGISSVLARHGFNLFIYEVDTLHKSEEEVLRSLRENMIAGAIFVGMSYDQRFFDTLHLLQDSDIPVVYVNRPVEYNGFPLVYPDFNVCAPLAADHLISKGCRRLALIHSIEGSPLLRIHMAAYRKAASTAGLSEPLFIRSEPGIAPPAEVIDEILESGIDGIFVINELMAAGILRALTSRGCKVPEDIAVISYGSSIVSEISVPALTNIDLQNYTLGVKSAEILMSQILGEPFEPVLILEPKVIEREST